MAVRRRVVVAPLPATPRATLTIHQRDSACRMELCRLSCQKHRRAWIRIRALVENKNEFDKRSLDRAQVCLPALHNINRGHDTRPLQVCAGASCTPQHVIREGGLKPLTKVGHVWLQKLTH